MNGKSFCALAAQNGFEESLKMQRNQDQSPSNSPTQSPAMSGFFVRECC